MKPFGSSIFQLLEKHPFFVSLSKEHLKILAGCGKNLHFQAGTFLAREGDPAAHFFVIRKGRVSVEIANPPAGTIAVQSLDESEIVGWSWLYPPHVWQFDVCATQETSVISLDGECLREKCEQNHELGFQLMKAFSRIMTRRLAATRLQLLQVYGASHD